MCKHLATVARENFLLTGRNVGQIQTQRWAAIWQYRSGWEREREKGEKRGKRKKRHHCCHFTINKIQSLRHLLSSGYWCTFKKIKEKQYNTLTSAQTNLSLSDLWTLWPKTIPTLFLLSESKLWLSPFMIPLCCWNLIWEHSKKTYSSFWWGSIVFFILLLGYLSKDLPGRQWRFMSTCVKPKEAEL